MQLTGKNAPSWLNRAATIGVALPCIVPRELLAPPDVETANGELVEDEDSEGDENTAMLRGHRRYPERDDSDYDSDDSDTYEPPSQAGSSKTQLELRRHMPR